MVSDNKTLDRVYTAENLDELREAYKDWAGDYDRDTVGRFGYVAHKNAADVLCAALPDGPARILDAGCGTGLVAEELVQKGHADLDALDFSAEMLAEAEKKGLYKRLMQADMSKPLPIDTNAYDAVICVGTFTYGHVDPAGLDELIRITRPGGLICFTVREGAYEDHDYRPRMVELEAARAWEQLEMRTEDYLCEEDVCCKVCLYRVC